MKKLPPLTILLFLSFFNLLAQNNSLNKDVSIEYFLDKETQIEKISINNLQANIDYSQNGIQIKWVSTPLTNAHHFIIEKSIDKMNWESVSTIFGAVHSEKVIEFIYMDYKPSKDNSYYRLKQINKKNQETYSNIVPVKYVKTTENKAGINLDPSIIEFKNTTNIIYEEIFDKEILLVLRDKKGEEFYSKFYLNLEEEAIVGVPLENEIPSGSYLITATSENQVYSQNIMIK